MPWRGHLEPCWRWKWRMRPRVCREGLAMGIHLPGSRRPSGDARSPLLARWVPAQGHPLVLRRASERLSTARSSWRSRGGWALPLGLSLEGGGGKGLCSSLGSLSPAILLHPPWPCTASGRLPFPQGGPIPSLRFKECEERFISFPGGALSPRCCLCSFQLRNGKPWKKGRAAPAPAHLPNGEKSVGNTSWVAWRLP